MTHEEPTSEEPTADPIDLDPWYLLGRLTHMIDSRGHITKAGWNDAIKAAQAKAEREAR